ncbi:RnfH family protein [Orrella marina]|uniref:UPF0125 protein DBV39_05395 n=1 Tax=Orrella marina TaxID=2163011 RepID=A0A2R4XPB1_9BURK|nr:RnfH family protein [Orrella marina]
MRVDVCYATSSKAIWYKTCQLPDGACIADAVRASGFEREHPQVDWITAGVGLFGERCSPDTQLKDLDRVEIYRPLVFDPKESRRRRAQHRREKLLRGEVSNERSRR